MCTELREQPALSVARVEVNYFQRRLPGTSIKAAFCFCLSFTPRLSLSPVSPLTSGPPPPPSLSLSLSTSVPASITRNTSAYRREHTRTCHRTPRHARCFCIPASLPRRRTASRLSARTLHECTRLPWLRRESARIARFLREPGNRRVSDETMCHGSLISHRKV